jgi:hypothetical protein
LEQFCFKKRKLSACCLWFWFSFFPIKQVGKSWDFSVPSYEEKKYLWVGGGKKGFGFGLFW